jgi:hypothetical protein
MKKQFQTTNQARHAIAGKHVTQAQIMGFIPAMGKQCSEVWGVNENNSQLKQQTCGDHVFLVFGSQGPQGECRFGQFLS